MATTSLCTRRLDFIAVAVKVLLSGLGRTVDPYVVIDIEILIVLISVSPLMSGQPTRASTNLGEIGSMTSSGLASKLRGLLSPDFVQDSLIILFNLSAISPHISKDNLVLNPVFQTRPNFLFYLFKSFR
jgi:hypothetical protein